MRPWAAIGDALSAGKPAAMVTVIAARGSTPREAGARMIVHSDGRFSGTIGGGTLEWRALALAQEALAARAGVARARVHRFPLGPDLGQCCGGDVQLLVEAFAMEDAPVVGALAEREARGPFATTGRITTAGVVREVTSTGAPPGHAVFDGGILSEGFGDDRRTLYLFGAGHVGRALALSLAPLPFAVTWFDPRPEAFPQYMPANVTAIAEGDPAAALAAAPERSFVLAMTHSHALDLAIVHASLADGRFAYVGVIGSRTKRARFAKRLAESGISAERIAELVCPIGIDGIAGKAPAVIAAAVAAELLIRSEAIRALAQPSAAIAAHGT